MLIACSSRLKEQIAHSGTVRESACEAQRRSPSLVVERVIPKKNRSARMTLKLPSLGGEFVFVRSIPVVSSWLAARHGRRQPLGISPSSPEMNRFRPNSVMGSPPNLRLGKGRAAFSRGVPSTLGQHVRRSLSAAHEACNRRRSEYLLACISPLSGQRSHHSDTISSPLRDPSARYSSTSMSSRRKRIPPSP